MVGFINSLFKPDQIQDGTRRAVMETVVTAREGLEQATNRLDETIRELMRDNDQIRKGRRHGQIFRD